jgi:hypothetical protein
MRAGREAAIDSGPQCGTDSAAVGRTIPNGRTDPEVRATRDATYGDEQAAKPLQGLFLLFRRGSGYER